MKKNGFTLVELMITVAVVAVLAMIAIPNYTQYVRRGNRTDATKTLMLQAQALERCYSQTFTYALPCAGVVAGPVNSPNGNYTITVQVPDPNVPVVVPPTPSFLITAVALSPSQLADLPCRTFTLNTSNTQVALTSAAAPNTLTCWGS